MISIFDPKCGLSRIGSNPLESRGRKLDVDKVFSSGCVEIVLGVFETFYAQLPAMRSEVERRRPQARWRI